MCIICQISVHELLVTGIRYIVLILYVLTLEGEAVKFICCYVNVRCNIMCINNSWR